MRLSWKEYLSGLPFPFPEYLPDSGIELTSPELAARFQTSEPPGKPLILIKKSKYQADNPLKYKKMFTIKNYKIESIPFNLGGYFQGIYSKKITGDKG